MHFGWNSIKLIVSDEVLIAYTSTELTFCFELIKHCVKDKAVRKSIKRVNKTLMLLLITFFQ